MDTHALHKSCKGGRSERPIDKTENSYFTSSNSLDIAGPCFFTFPCSPRVCPHRQLSSCMLVSLGKAEADREGRRDLAKDPPYESWA